MSECIFKTRRERTRVQDFKCQLRANTFQPINFNVGEQKPSPFVRILGALEERWGQV